MSLQGRDLKEGNQYRPAVGEPSAEVLTLEGFEDAREGRAARFSLAFRSPDGDGQDGAAPASAPASQGTVLVSLADGLVLSHDLAWETSLRIPIYGGAVGHLSDRTELEMWRIEDPGRPR